MSLQIVGINYLSLASAPSVGNTVHLNIKFSTFATGGWGIGYSASDALFGRANIGGTPLFLSETTGTDFFGSQVITDNVWNAITWTWNGTTDNLYLNGNLEISTTGMSTKNRLAINLAYAATGFNNDNVHIDGLKIWQAVLTPQEIRNEIHSIKPKRWQDLWTWLPCNNGATLGSDYSGDGRNFTQNGIVVESPPSPVAWGDSTLLIPQASAIN